MNSFMKNCCDGVYNSFDVHFTSACDNKCSHCIDLKYDGIGSVKPDVDAISKTVIDNCQGYDDVLFLGGEPCLYLSGLVECIERIKEKTELKVFVTTSVPKTCYTNYCEFEYLLSIVDGINLSVQHHNESVADEIRRTKSKFDRQLFYSSLPNKQKIRINLNIVKPYLYTKKDISDCLYHYDSMGFNEIKLSEIQHGEDYFISFEKVFNLDMKSPFYGGCQSYVDTSVILPNLKTPLLLKRSCFLCEKTLKASFMDGVKILYRMVNKPNNKYGVIYEDGTLLNGWM